LAATRFSAHSERGMNRSMVVLRIGWGKVRRWIAGEARQRRMSKTIFPN